MPKKTFYNLNADKQAKVMQAVVKEFSRVPLSEALVSNIVTSAEIPRGSFYQYFSSLEDAFYYVLEMHSKDIKKKLIESLKKQNGDLILAFLESFKYVMDKVNQKDNVDYFKHIFLNLDYKTERYFTPNLEDHLSDIINLVDVSILNIDSKLQLIYVIDVLEAITLRNIVQSFKRNISKEKIEEIFVKEMGLIVLGIKKRI